VPVVLQIHDGKFGAFYLHSRAILRAWIRYTLGSVQRVIALSRDGEARLRAIAPRARFCVVPNGLGEQQMADLTAAAPACDPQVLFVGTGDAQLNEEKGLGDLLSILPTLATTHSESRWVLAGLSGSGETRDRVYAARPELQGDDRIRFMGCVDGEDKVALLRSSTILVLPSYFENMPNILLEAMAAGMGVVATGVGAIPEMLGHGKGGVLIDPGHPEALKKSLDLMLREPARALKQGRWNRDMVLRRYGMSAVERELRSVYLDAAGWLEPKTGTTSQGLEANGGSPRTARASVAGEIAPT
jgi:glycosyltransferase involved in cell wall biosynthesis